MNSSLGVCTIMAELNPSHPVHFRKLYQNKNLNFYFHTSCGSSKGFMKALKAFIKPLQASQRNVKIKILNQFSLFARDRYGERLISEKNVHFPNLLSKWLKTPKSDLSNYLEYFVISFFWT